MSQLLLTLSFVRKPFRKILTFFYLQIVHNEAWEFWTFMDVEKFILKNKVVFLYSHYRPVAII